MNEPICKHGSQKRKCPICELEDDLKSIRNDTLDAVKVAIQKLDIDENFSGQKINGYICCKGDALRAIEALKDE